MIINGVASALLSPIFYALFGVFWGIFISFPFLLLNGIFYAIKFFGFEFFQVLAFGTSDPEKLGSNSVPAAFLGAAIISIALLLISIIIVVIKYHFGGKDTKEGQTSIKTALKNVIPAISIIVFIPLILFLFNLLMMVAFESLEKALSLSEYGSSKLNVIEKIYISLNSDYPSVKEAMETKGIFAPPSYTEWFTPFLFSPWDIGIRFLINAIVGWTTLTILGGIVISVVVKVFHLFFLFIISPFVAVSSVMDGGKNLHKWKEMYIQKNLAILTQTIAIQFYLIFVIGIEKYLTELKNGTRLNTVAKTGLLPLLQIIIYCGSAVAIKSLSNLVVSFIGESTTQDDLKSAMAPFKTGLKLASGVAMAAGAVASGGATLGVMAAKGGVSGLIGGTIGKAINGTRQSISYGKQTSAGFSKEGAKMFSNSGVNKNNINAQKENLAEMKSLAHGVENTGSIAEQAKAFENPEAFRNMATSNYDNYQKEIDWNKSQLSLLENKANKTKDEINTIQRMKNEIKDMEFRKEAYANRTNALLSKLQWEKANFNK
ncbi:Mbov_0396 family ICE element transmembrane protein [Mycoplasmopsis cynos]|uniref:Mbov_0396 family ICE element transmembrane protein n=1 Tax=Mycoplasmopsis cynos TaxID=171284 RepID=UPI00396A0A5B